MPGSAQRLLVRTPAWDWVRFASVSGASGTRSRGERRRGGGLGAVRVGFRGFWHPIARRAPARQAFAA
jgi:hypothetical protein